MPNLYELRTTQLDARIAKLAPLRDIHPPPQGWVRTIREGLGMSLRQLGDRTGKSKAGVAAMESREVAGTITLESMQALAAGLESSFVYAVLPHRSLEATIEARAREIASAMVTRLAKSMELEAQGTALAERERLHVQMTKELLNDRARLWDVR
jgi:predicted DNA-binding mobile mystery protein A